MSLQPAVFQWGPFNKMLFGTAPPTLAGEGPYSVGDAIINTAPSTTSPFGWMCTTAGTGATSVWLAFGVQAQSTNFTSPGGIPATAASGVDTAGINGTVWITALYIPYTVTLTGLAYLIGSVGGTDKAISILFSSSGAVLANSATAGTTVGTAATMQSLDFTATVKVNPGLYFAGIVYNGTTAKIRTQAVGIHPTTSISQTFGTPVAITPPTTFTTAVGPIVETY